jgi:hypothetical protein
VKRLEKLKIVVIIKEFNLLYKYLSSGYNAYITLLGQISADLTISATLAPSQLSKIKYSTYSLPHKLWNYK